MAKIYKETIDEYFSAKSKLEKLEYSINDRLDEIIEFIMTSIGFKNRKHWTWYFDGAKEGGMGEITILTHDNKEYIENIRIDLHKDTYEKLIPWTDNFDGSILIDYLFSDDYKEKIKKILNKYFEEIKNNKKNKELYNKKNKEVCETLEKERKRIMDEYAALNRQYKMNEMD